MPKISGFIDFLYESGGTPNFLEEVDFSEIKDEVVKKSWSLSSLEKTGSLKKFDLRKNIFKSDPDKSSFFITYNTDPLSKIEGFIEKDCELNIFPVWSEEFNGIDFFRDENLTPGSAKVKDPWFGVGSNKFSCDYNANSVDSLAKAIDSAFDEIIKKIQSVRIRPKFKDKGKIPLEILKPLISDIQDYYKKLVHNFFREGQEMENPEISLSGMIAGLIANDNGLSEFFTELPIEIQQGIVDSKEFNGIQDQKIKGSLEKQVKAKKLLKYI